MTAIYLITEFTKLYSAALAQLRSSSSIETDDCVDILKPVRPFCRLGGDAFSDKDFSRNSQSVMQTANHGQCKRSLVIEYFSHSCSAPDELFKVSSRETTLLHRKQNSFDGIRQVDGPMLFFPSLN